MPILLKTSILYDSGVSQEHCEPPHPARRHGQCLTLCVLLATLLLASSGGCASSAAKLRSVPKSPLVDELQLTARGGPQPSARTMQLLRVYNLADELNGDPRQLLQKLQALTDREASAEKVYAMAELAYLGGKKAEIKNQPLALDLYGASVLHAYRYLFDGHLADLRSPYDPQFRGACDLYNGALEGALRIVRANHELTPGTTKTIHTASGSWDITCVLRGSSWRMEDFGRFEFVSDYEIKGLKNHYQTHGLGVPLIAVRRSYPGEPAATKYYPPGLSFPVTAFLRPLGCTSADEPAPDQHQCVLELYDPLSTSALEVAGQRLPLESDLSTPLAYFLSNPALDSLAWAGLLRPESLMALRPDRPDPIMGLYMAQPYEPGKIPVLFVHGLWSSPMTWMEMFNDLRSSPEIRKRYQFWFYLYPTGQPFWLTANQLRRDLAEVRQVVDPIRQEAALDEMVIIGHSMGGLVSRLQTVSSGDEFWKLASSEPLEMVRSQPDVRQKLQEVFYFQPNPSIRRVVTIATPHRGSRFSNETTQWLLDKIIHLPQMLVNSQQELFRENQGAFPGSSLLRIETSIDSLAPDCPVFPVLLASRHLPWVKYHNIIGVIPNTNWFTSWVAGSDGVVSLESARVDGVASELIVPADHASVHAHPAAVLEVHRILLEHLAELRGMPATSVAQQTVGIRR